MRKESTKEENSHMISLLLCQEPAAMHLSLNFVFTSLALVCTLMRHATVISVLHGNFELYPLCLRFYLFIFFPINFMMYRSEYQSIIASARQLHQCTW